MAAAAEYVPASQSAHALAPELAAKVPAAHLTQAKAPLAAAHPAAHEAQDVAPVAPAVVLPASQAVQAELPVAVA